MVARYDDNIEKIMEKQVLIAPVSNDESKFVRCHIYDYSRHLLHTEDTTDVLEKSRVKYDPNAENKISLIC